MRKVILLFLLAVAGFSLWAQDIPLGTVVGGGITVPDSRTDIPTHYDVLGKGGYRVVATKPERDTIKMSRRSIGMLVYVNVIDSTYRLVANPDYPGDVTRAVWVSWLPVVYSATYNITKSTPPDDEIDVYPYHQARTPFYFAKPFLTNLYFLAITCRNDRGMVPYVILEQKKESFTIDVAEPCTCTWEAKERIVGQSNPDVVDTGDGDILPSDVAMNKIGYAKGQRIVGSLDVDSVAAEAYRQGANDAIAFNRDPLWWDIKTIVDADNTPGYVAKMGVLLNDEWLDIMMSGADAYRTSDGEFYTVSTPNTLVTHTWLPEAYKPDSKGGRTKYVIRYYKTAVISSSASNQPSFGAATALNRGLGGWPVGITCRDGSIFMQNFLNNNYSLVFYDHTNCQYTGANASGFLGGNTYCLQGIPESISYPNPFPTATLGMYGSRVLKKISVEGWDWSRLPVTLNGYFANMYLLEEIAGVMDLERVTTWGTCLNASYMLRKFTIRNCGISLTLMSSVIEYETLRDLIWNGLKDMTGFPAPTLNVAGSWRALTSDDTNELSRKNWILTMA